MGAQPRRGATVGRQRVRPVQDRDRALELAHRRADAGRAAVRAPARASWPARGDGPAPDRALRLARRDRPRARHGQGDPPGPRGRAAGPGRGRRDRRAARGDPLVGPSPDPRPARRRVRRTRGPRVLPGGQRGRRNAVPRQQPALHRVRRRWRRAPIGHVLLGRRRVRRERRAGRGWPGPATVRSRTSTSCRSRTAARTSSWSSPPPRARTSPASCGETSATGAPTTRSMPACSGSGPRWRRASRAGCARTAPSPGRSPCAAGPPRCTGR